MESGRSKILQRRPIEGSRVLEKAGKRYQIHDPKTWPQQSKLAAAGQWDKLQKLQDKLNGGKKTSKATNKKAAKKKTRR